MLYEDALEMIHTVLEEAKPDAAVRKALSAHRFGKGEIVLVAIGKAAWQMAKSACETLGAEISRGVVITKYHHVKGDLPGLKMYEAGHPVPDANSVSATEAAIAAVKELTAEDTVLFLVSGGGSALFEKPLVELEELESITQQLLASCADIVEINTLRKRFSAVKGGRFAQICAPANIFSIVLSDIIGDPLDMIASGPAYPDSSTCEEALQIVKKYEIALSEQAAACLTKETPKHLENVVTQVTGSVGQLCVSAEKKCRALGYEPMILTDSLSCTARDAGSFLASIARYHQNAEKSLAFLAGGETVVKLTGTGKGGRNQEIALAAAQGIAGLKDTAVFSVGSDGTDGPTDAAGGYADGTSKTCMETCGINIAQALAQNNAYPALEAAGGLLVTGPTGTNVNDLSVVLIKR